eukprot:GEMP01065028.1.p1 GENE.GEMP01065028.1~~GEMP01065028.1.p1  ORF type:complete len:176 (+),score=11.48 GEMP01065028.1:40-528(+)
MGEHYTFLPTARASDKFDFSTSRELPGRVDEYKERQAELVERLRHIRRQNKQYRIKIAEQDRLLGQLRYHLAENRDPEPNCLTCDVLPLQVNAVLQSLVGLCSRFSVLLSESEHPPRHLLVHIMLQYLKPCIDLDPELARLYETLRLGGAPACGSSGPVYTR